MLSVNKALLVANTLKGRTLLENYWVARSEVPFAAWTGSLPWPATPSAEETILQLAHDILAAGASEDVYEVQQTYNPPGFGPQHHGTYAQFLDRRREAGVSVPLFNLGSGVAPTADGQLVTPAHISYFDVTGMQTESNIGDMGALLQHLRPDDADWGSTYMARVAPITIVSPPLAVTGNSPAGRSFTLSVELFTDIWFPVVLGLLEDMQSGPEQHRRWYGNARLAQIHTPRLNRFLLSVKDLIEHAGGTWIIEVPEGTARHYSFQVHDTGIHVEKSRAVFSTGLLELKRQCPDCEATITATGQMYHKGRPDAWLIEYWCPKQKELFTIWNADLDALTNEIAAQSANLI